MESDEIKEGELLEKGKPLSRAEKARLNGKKGGRPKGKKDSKPRVRSPTLKQMTKVDPDLPSKTQAIFYSRFINSGNLEKVLEKMMAAALDDDHKLQGLAWQELSKRALPMELFEKGRSGGGPQININITGVDDVEIDSD